MRGPGDGDLTRWAVCCAVLCFVSSQVVASAFTRRPDSSTPDQTVGVRFIAPHHIWLPDKEDSEAKPLSESKHIDIFMKESGHPKYDVNDSTLLQRTKRKVLSRGGFYLLRSKMLGSPWLNPGSGGPGSYSRDVRGAYTGGWGSRSGMGRRYGSGNRGRHGNRRGGSDRGRNGRRKISQNLKMEIGQYAQQKGAKEAAEQYESRVGRKLKERIVEKFARRYRLRKERRSERAKDGRKRLKEERL